MRLIDSEKLEEKIEYDFKHKKITRYDRELLLHYLDIEMLIVANALLKEQEAKTGHWIIVEYDTLTCSCCGKFYYTGCDSTKEAIANIEKGNAYRYCPHCGAKMEGR